MPYRPEQTRVKRSGFAKGVKDGQDRLSDLSRTLLSTGAHKTR